MNKKTIVGLAAVALLSMMIANAYARIPVREPSFCEWECQGLTPGFWKHNLQVYLDHTNGKYSAAYETKVTPTIMTNLLTSIKGALSSQLTLDALAHQLLENLQLPGWESDRTNTANWFNYFMGFGPYED